MKRWDEIQMNYAGRLVPKFCRKCGALLDISDLDTIKYHPIDGGKITTIIYIRECPERKLGRISHDLYSHDRYI